MPRSITGGRRFSDVEATLLAIIGGEGEASISNKLQEHSSHVLIRQKSQQLTGEAAVPDGVISRCQIDQHRTGLFFSLK